MAMDATVFRIRMELIFRRCWNLITLRGLMRFPMIRVTELGREPINLERTVDVRFGAHSGLKSDMAPCPKSATSGLMQCSMQHPYSITASILGSLTSAPAIVGER